jgi:hypothetical protein
MTPDVRECFDVPSPFPRYEAIASKMDSAYRTEGSWYSGVRLLVLLHLS